MRDQDDETDLPKPGTRKLSDCLEPHWLLTMHSPISLPKSSKLNRKPVICDKPVISAKPRIQPRQNTVQKQTKPLVQPKPSLQELQDRIKAMACKDHSDDTNGEYAQNYGESLHKDLKPNHMFTVKNCTEKKLNKQLTEVSLRHSYSADNLDSYAESSCPPDIHSLSSDNSSGSSPTVARNTSGEEPGILRDQDIEDKVPGENSPNHIVVNGQVYSRVNKKVKLRKLKKKNKDKEDMCEKDHQDGGLRERTLSESNLSKLSKQLKRPFSTIVLGKQSKRASLGSVFAEPFLR